MQSMEDQSSDTTRAGDAATSGLSHSPGNKKPKSERSKLLDYCIQRVWKGDMTVFEECFTPDFRLTQPESKLISPSGSFHGKSGLETLSRILRADPLTWGSMAEETVWEIESEDRIVRESRLVAKNPSGPYGGFQALPPDLEVTIRLIHVYTFKDGKICDEFTTYDHLGYYFDMAEGDLKRAAQAIANSSAWWMEMRAALERGEMPLPDPGHQHNELIALTECRGRGDATH
jgi:hypothetical protein